MVKKIILRPSFQLDELLSASLLIFLQESDFYFGRRGRVVQDKEGVELLLSFPDEDELSTAEVACFDGEISNNPQLNNYAPTDSCYAQSVLDAFEELKQQEGIQALVEDIKSYTQQKLNPDDRPVSLYTVIEYYKFGYQERLLMRAVDFCLAALKGANIK